MSKKKKGEGSKPCSKCGVLKLLEEFPWMKSSTDGLGSWCLACASAHAKKKYASDPEKYRSLTRAYREKNPDSAAQYQRDRRKLYPGKVKDCQLRYKYGITIDDWNRMFELQKGACAICKIAGVCLCVDHNHTTGKVRELLCVQCNYAIAHLKDCAKLALEAASYLTRHEISQQSAGVNKPKTKLHKN